MLRRFLNKIAIYRYLTLLALPVPLAADWVEVDPIRKYSLDSEMIQEDLDSSIWVLFCKKLGSEIFTIRFPVDPEVAYVPCGVVYTASGADISCSLSIFDKQEVSFDEIFQKSLCQSIEVAQCLVRTENNSWEIVSRDGKTQKICTVLQNHQYFFVFETESVNSQDFPLESHQKFLSSFSFES